MARLETPRIRVMRGDDVNLAIEWAASEGWNPGHSDAETFFAADPEGFLVAEIDGEPVGTVAAVVYDDAFAFFGLYIVRPDLRGHGIGMALTRAAMTRFADRNAGLDGVVAMQNKYGQIGFRYAHRNIRFEAIANESPIVANDVIDLASFDFAEILAYDRRHFPSPRTKFLRQWIDQTGAVAVGMRRHGALVGMGVLRPCQVGFKIGPLFADNAEIAEILYAALARHAVGRSVFLDVPETNTAAVALADRHGMKRVFETARMYTKGPPDIDACGVYGVTTFELG